MTRKKFCNAIFGDSKSFSFFAARFLFLFLIFAVKVLAGESAIKLVQQIYDWQHNTHSLDRCLYSHTHRSTHTPSLAVYHLSAHRGIEASASLSSFARFVILFAVRSVALHISHEYYLPRRILLPLSAPFLSRPLPA